MHTHTTVLLPSLSQHVHVRIYGVKHVCEGFMHTKKNTTIIITATIGLADTCGRTICGAQQHRALMMILQYHKTLSMISMMLSQCPSHVLLRHPRSCILCFFGKPYIFPFQFTEFFIYLSPLFFICFAV